MSPEQRVPVVLLGDLTLLRPLAMARIPAIVAATDPADTTLKSRHARTSCLLPGLDTERSAASLEKLVTLARELADRHGTRPPLVYGSDESLAFLYRHRERIEDCFAILLNEPDVSEALLYKHAFSSFAASRGVRVPRTLEEDVAQMDAPVIVKPRSKVAYDPVMRSFLGPNAKARVFESGRALTDDPAWSQVGPDVVVQELIPGGEGCLLSFHGFADERGRMLASFCGRKVRAFPSPAGESSLVELVLDDELARHGAQIAERLGLRGPFKIDLIRDPRTGLFYTLEVNARYTLWHHLAAVEGINIPAIAYEYLVHGTRPVEQHYVPRHRWVDLYRDYKSFEQQRRQGEIDAVAWLRSLVERPNVHEAFAWDDPAPALAWLGGEVSRAMRKRLTRLARDVGAAMQTW